MNRKFRLGAIMMIALVSTIIGIGVTPILLQQQSVYSVGGGVDDKKRMENAGLRVAEKKGEPAKIATSGDNVYIAWGTNNTAHPDIMFRASTDSGKTFGEKINLSNTSNVDSVDREIAASGSNVFVAWWERGNQTNNEAVMKISTDNGKTFGPLLKLAANGTIGSSGGG
jgi:hypothetical protein